MAEIRLDLFCLLAATLHHKHTKSQNNFSHLLNRTFLHKFWCVFFSFSTSNVTEKIFRYSFCFRISWFNFLGNSVHFYRQIGYKIDCFRFQIVDFFGTIFYNFFLFQLILVFFLRFFQHFCSCFEEDKYDPFRETTLKLILGYLFWWITAPLGEDPKRCIKGIAEQAIQLAFKSTFNTFGQIHQALNELSDEACKNTLAADYLFYQKK